MALQTAIDRYHALLTDELAQESHEHLVRQLQGRGLTFGDRLLINVLRPRLIEPQQYRLLQERVRVVLHAFDKVYQRAMEDTQFRQQLAEFSEPEIREQIVRRVLPLQTATQHFDERLV